MEMRENFIYYLLGMINLKLMLKTNFTKCKSDEQRTEIFHTMNQFLAECNKSPMMPFEVKYIDKILQFDKQLDEGIKIAKSNYNE